MKVIRSMSATFQPYAECVEDDCNFAARPSSVSRDMAKGHVTRTGHSVRVIKETVDIYSGEEKS